MTNKTDWEQWHQERVSFAGRESQGFLADLEALKQHIQKLTEIAPKDKTGWLNGNALLIIDQLTTDYLKGKELYDQSNTYS